jgi:hypothetical protein
MQSYRQINLAELSEEGKRLVILRLRLYGKTLAGPTNWTPRE